MTTATSTYRTDCLDNIANVASMVKDLTGKTDADALTFALDKLSKQCADIIGGHRSAGEWSTEQVDEYRDLAGVVADVRNGFISPTIGNVRDYVLGRL